MRAKDIFTKLMTSNSSSEAKPKHLTEQDQLQETQSLLASSSKQLNRTTLESLEPSETNDVQCETLGLANDDSTKAALATHAPQAQSSGKQEHSVAVDATDESKVAEKHKQSTEADKVEKASAMALSEEAKSCSTSAIKGENGGSESAADADKAGKSSSHEHDGGEQIIEHRRYSEDRALYNISHALVRKCTFAGVSYDHDGCGSCLDNEALSRMLKISNKVRLKSTGFDDDIAFLELDEMVEYRVPDALRECADLKVEGCIFKGPYALWHNRSFNIRDCIFEVGSDAPLWNSYRGQVCNTSFNSHKVLRHCLDVRMNGCEIVGAEFGWKSSALNISNSQINSHYCLLESRNVELKDSNITSPYALQYVEDGYISNCLIEGHDSLWYARNLTLHNCTITGARIGWYSDNLTLSNCTISSEQALCYCKRLQIVNCTFDNCDDAFECSDLDADISGHINSIMSPLSGRISADSIGTVDQAAAAFTSTCIITNRSKQNSK